MKLRGFISSFMFFENMLEPSCLKGYIPKMFFERYIHYNKD